jgi:hypothetical protein
VGYIRLHGIWETREGVKRFFSVFLWHRVSIFEQPLSPALDASRHLGSTLLGGRHGCAGTLGPWSTWAKGVRRAHHSASPLRRCRHSHTTWVAYSFWRFVFCFRSRFLLSLFELPFPKNLVLTWSTVQLSVPSFPFRPSFTKKARRPFIVETWFNA